MSSVVIASIGVGIACCIFIVVALVVYRRAGSKKNDAGVMHRWVPLHVADKSDDDEFAAEREDPEQEPGFDVHSKVQQNGHYSESKRRL